MSTNTSKNYPSTGVSASSSTGQRKMVRYILPEHAMIGNYRIEKALGRGGMGEVYLAFHVTSKIYRAIKILLPTIAQKDVVYAERFLKEARLAAEDLRHPNIINVMIADYNKEHDLYYIVMEYVDGVSIRKILKTKGRFEEKEALKIILKVAEVLCVAEKKKIVHRDIKPDNIMMTTQGEVKLADLGIAKAGVETETSVDLTAPQMMLGTIAYISPEQASDAQSVDSRADIYSLGITLYEMLAAKKPYSGSQMEILQQVFNAPVPNIQATVQSVSDVTAKLLKKMMAKDKKDRPQSFEILCRLLHHILDDRTGVVNPKDDPVIKKKIAELNKTQTILIEEKQKLEEKSREIDAKLSEREQKLEEERKQIVAARKKLEEDEKKIKNRGKFVTEEQKKISDEKKKISEKEKRYSEEKLRIVEERRRERRENFNRFIQGVGNALQSRFFRRAAKFALWLILFFGLVYGLFYLNKIDVLTKENLKHSYIHVKNACEWCIDKIWGPDITVPPESTKEIGLSILQDNVEARRWLEEKSEGKIFIENDGQEIALPLKSLLANKNEKIKNVSLFLGEHKVTVHIPGNEDKNFTFNTENSEWNIPVVPPEGKICFDNLGNVKWQAFFVRDEDNSGKWYDVKKDSSLSVPAFTTYVLFLRAPGYKTIIEEKILKPNEKITIHIDNQKMKDFSEFEVKCAEAIRKYNEKTDLGKVRQFFEKEANIESKMENGNPVAAYYYGLMLYDGSGVVVSDHKKAIEYFKKACDGEYPKAFYELGLCEESRGFYEDASTIFKKGAEYGEYDCFLKLGEYYLNGWGCVKNYVFARQYFLLLDYEKKDPRVMLDLGETYYAEGNKQKAKKWYETCIRNCGSQDFAVEKAALKKLNK